MKRNKPGLPSYALGKLADSLHCANKPTHRSASDVACLTEILKKIFGDGLRGGNGGCEVHFWVVNSVIVIIMTGVRCGSEWGTFVGEGEEEKAEGEEHFFSQLRTSFFSHK